MWLEYHQATYGDLKICIDREPCMSYYHPKKKTVLEVDAKQKGLGASLVHDNNTVVEDGSMPCDRPVNVLLYLMFYYCAKLHLLLPCH